MDDEDHGRTGFACASGEPDAVAIASPCAWQAPRATGWIATDVQKRSPDVGAIAGHLMARDFAAA
jgi:hypothetical protein